MRITFVTTIYNEERTIKRLLDSLQNQTQLPDEVIIVDGGSRDNTVAKIKSYLKTDRHLQITLFEKKGNRSVGRNEGVKRATGDIIVFSDGGCILERNFIEEIVKPFNDKSVDVVAGYYTGEAKNIFQKCLIPYVLVMPDRVNPESFLPATRSMAIRKRVFMEMGGFDGRYSYNEDYVFSRKLEKHKKNIKFARNAVVRWMPRSSFKQAFIMFYRFALGDMQAGLLRPKVIFLFVRYFAVIILFVFLFYFPIRIILMTLLLLFLLYSFWAVGKNYRYVRDWKAFLYLPLIQYTADLAVLLGTVRGLLKS